jgi:hypothetical protein
MGSLACSLPGWLPGRRYITAITDLDFIIASIHFGLADVI